MYHLLLNILKVLIARGYLVYRLNCFCKNSQKFRKGAVDKNGTLVYNIKCIFINCINVCKRKG